MNVIQWGPTLYRDKSCGKNEEIIKIFLQEIQNSVHKGTTSKIGEGIYEGKLRVKTQTMRIGGTAAATRIYY